MRIGILTREWPPEVYGGAGVHVEYLARELAKLVDVDVHAFGGAGATVHSPDPGLAGTNAALQTLSVDLRMAAAVAGCDVLHSHTWYADLAGHLGSLLHGVPHVVTTHSLEPHRPWKADQLGGGYQVSSWAERTALRVGAAPSSRSPTGCAPTCSRPTPSSTRPRCTSCTTASTPRSTGPCPRSTCSSPLGIDPSVPVRAVRRPDHAPEGRRAPAALRPLVARPAGALRRLAGHPGDRGVRRRR